MTNGRSYDTLDDCGNVQSESDQNTSAKSKKKAVEKRYINETIYEMDDVENLRNGSILWEELLREPKRYKCSSPRRRYQRSVKSPELETDYDDCDLVSNVERTMPVDMPDSHRHTRTYSSSSEIEE